MSQGPVYFVHISDTHIGPERSYARHGLQSHSCAAALVDLINRLPHRPDFVVHTGDVVTDPHPVSYALAAELFSKLDVPIYYAVGNHDTAADIKQELPMGPRVDLVDDPDRLAYTFEVKDQRFMVLDGRAPDDQDPHGHLSDAQMVALKRELARETDQPLTVFCHFPLLPMDSPWIDANMLMLNGDEVHSALKSAAGRVRGYLHGHIHMPLTHSRDGVIYSGVASAFANFGTWPHRHEPDFLKSDPGYCVVASMPESFIIHHHTFERPADEPI